MEKILLEVLCVTHLRIRIEQEQSEESTNQRDEATKLKDNTAP